MAKTKREKCSHTKREKCSHYWNVIQTINIIPDCETFDLIVECKRCKRTFKATGSID